MYAIATLDALRRRLGIAPGDEDDRLLAALQAASMHVERLAGRRFTPHRATLRHDAPAHSVRLSLEDDLLQLISLTDASGQIPLRDIQPLRRRSPASAIRLRNGRRFAVHGPLNAVIAVEGVWGWHDNWPRAWRDSGDTLQTTGLAPEATALTVNNPRVEDSAHEKPRFQVGHLLRLDNEYCRVLAITDDVLTVQRGANGTAAAPHQRGSRIFTFQPPADIALTVLRLAGWFYKEPDNRPSGPLPASIARHIDPIRRHTVKV